jgi:hypothetical protein
MADEVLIVGIGASLVFSLLAVLGVLALAREIGILVARAGPQRPMINQEGLNIGEAIADPDLLADPSVNLGPRKWGDALVVFLSPSCLVCRDLTVPIAAFARSYRRDVRVIAVIKPLDGPDLEAMVRPLRQAGVAVTHNERWFERFNVLGTPFATLLDPTNRVRARGTVNTLAQIESLLGLEIRTERRKHRVQSHSVEITEPEGGR